MKMEIIAFLATLTIGLLPVTGCQPPETEKQTTYEEVQPQEYPDLEYALPYCVVSEGNLGNEDPSRSVGLWFITSESASCFEEYAETSIQAVRDLYSQYGRDYTSVMLIPSEHMKYSGVRYASASFAADGKGAAGMTGSAPAKKMYWKVRAADRQLNELELSIAELWQAKQQDFPQHDILSSLSYDSEALRYYISGELNIPYEEAQMPELVMHEYKVDMTESTPGKWQTLSSDNTVLDMLVDGNELWAATSNGVIHWDMETGSRRIYTTRDGLGSNETREIIRDSRGNIWVTCYTSGISRFDGNKWESFSVKNGLCSDEVITLAADKTGGVWVSAYWGVSYFDGEHWSSYSNVSPDEIVIGGENPMKDCHNLTFVDAELSAVDVIFVDSSGDIWFSDRSRGVTRFDGKNWRMFTSEDGLTQSGVYDIFEDKTGNLWFGNHGGVTRFDGDGFTVFTIGDYQSVIPRPIIQDIMQDTRGNIWIAAYGGGAARFDGSEWQTFLTADGLPGDNAQALFIYTNGYPGIITNNGVCTFDGSTWEVLTEADGLPGGKVRVVINDEQGNLWFGGEGGVSYYSK
jgi:ligand-binding sensor domain-containing protein